MQGQVNALNKPAVDFPNKNKTNRARKSKSSVVDFPYKNEANRARTSKSSHRPVVDFPYKNEANWACKDK
jgi:hypothetical protein